MVFGTLLNPNDPTAMTYGASYTETCRQLGRYAGAGRRDAMLPILGAMRK
jgi:hypothetical protein